MKIYLAGVEGTQYRTNDTFGILHYLLTYADLMQPSYAKKCFAHYDKTNIDLFLDSGAYTAMTKGLPVKLHEYISFIRKHGHRFKLIAALDDIESPERTLDNFMDMSYYLPDVPLVPTYHYGEPQYYLEQYAGMSDYMAIGGLVGRNSSEIAKMTAPRLIQFAKQCSYLARKINPRIKIHLFGVGIEQVIRQVAKYVESVDTTQWLSVVRYGSLSVKGYDMPTNKMIYPRLAQYLRFEVHKWLKLEKDINEQLEMIANG